MPVERATFFEMATSVDGHAVGCAWPALVAHCNVNCPGFGVPTARPFRDSHGRLVGERNVRSVDGLCRQQKACPSALYPSGLACVIRVDTALNGREVATP
ncbi:MAG TPA: hypothetical protein VN108_06500 [Marmoricola sp.]|nr:hypothetical protein [Marmoricola sp.]